jgi:DNA-binding NarL/FixJ family response regulator
MAELILLAGDVGIHRFPLMQEEILIGRNPASDIMITDASVSSRHAKLHCSFDDHGEVDTIVLEDLNSTNGTQVNGQFVTRQQLLNADIVRVGSTQLKLLHERADDTSTLVTSTEHLHLREKLKHVDLNSLSPREQEVFFQIGQGKQRKEIARDLNLSAHTIADHVKAIYRKLDISSKQEAVLIFRNLNSRE